MIEWLLKEEEKAKVGRPKLADSFVLKKAKISIAISFLMCAIMAFIFVCDIKNLKPLDVLYSNTFQRLTASSNNSSGFIVKEKYDSKNDYIIELTPSKNIKKYNGTYKYVLYELSKNKWKKVDEKIIDKKDSKIKIKIKSRKNTNVTYKVNVYILNALKIEKSFAPFSWNFADSKKTDEKYAYKVFTVKGYYSPISIEEIKEANKSKNNKIIVETSQKNPRLFTIKVPNIIYDLKIDYKDENGKIISFVNKKNISESTSYLIPDVNKLTNVTIKIWTSDVNQYKLSNWKLEKDKNNKEYITNSYNLKPYSNYK